MVEAALRSGTADRRCVFEVFARRLPTGRRYGVVAGTGRLLEALGDFRFDADELEFLRRHAAWSTTQTAAWLADYRFTGDVDGLRRGRAVLPGLADPHRRGHLRRGVVLETLVLSILNHDCAIAAAAARMVTAARGRPCIEMGSRRTHEEAAVAAARAAYLAGFAVHLQPGGRPAVRHPHHRHRGARLHAAARRRADRVRRRRSPRWARTPRCSWTPTTSARASATRSRWPGRTSAPSGSTPATCRCWPTQSRALLDSLGATETKIVVTGDLDEYAIAALAAEPGRRLRRRHRAWSPARARRPPAWSTSWSRCDGPRRWPSAPSTRPPSAAGRRRCAGTSRPAPPPRRSSCRRASPRPQPTTGRCSVRSWSTASRWRCRRWTTSRGAPARVPASPIPWEGLKLSARRPGHPGRPSYPQLEEGALR